MGSRAIGQSGRLVPDRHFRDALRLAEVAVVRASAVGIRQDLVSFVDLLESGRANRSSDILVHAPGRRCGAAGIKLRWVCKYRRSMLAAGGIAVPSQMPFREAQFLQLLLRLLQGHQAVPFGLCHQ